MSTDVDKLSISELKALLKHHGLSPVGERSLLISRWNTAMCIEGSEEDHMDLEDVKCFSCDCDQRIENDDTYVNPCGACKTQLCWDCMSADEEIGGACGTCYKYFFCDECLIDGNCPECQPCRRIKFNTEVTLDEMVLDQTTDGFGENPNEEISDSLKYPLATREELDRELERYTSKRYWWVGNLPMRARQGMTLVDFVEELAINQPLLNYDTEKVTFDIGNVLVALDTKIAKKVTVFVNGHDVTFTWCHIFPVGHTWFVHVTDFQQ